MRSSAARRPVEPVVTLPADPSAVLLSPEMAGQIADGLSQRSIRRLVAAGRFPRPVPILTDATGRTQRAGWVLAEVLDFNRQRIAAARGSR